MIGLAFWIIGLLLTVAIILSLAGSVIGGAARIGYALADASHNDEFRSQFRQFAGIVLAAVAAAGIGWLLIAWAAQHH